MIKTPLLLVLTLLFSCTTESTQSTEPTTPAMLGHGDLQKNITINSDKPVDLLTCIEEHSFPPHLNEDIYWTLPDTSDWGYRAKNAIAIKYRFDSIGRIVQYYYKGSLISGEFPLAYEIDYDKSQPNAIHSFEDFFAKEEYTIAYYEDGGVKQIEKRDSTGSVVELLTVQPIN